MVNISYIPKMMIMMLNHEIRGYWVNYPIFSFFLCRTGFQVFSRSQFPSHSPTIIIPVPGYPIS